jgi:hypothetical protein
MLRSRPFYGIAGHALWRRYNRTVRYCDKAPLVLSQIFNTDLDLAKKRLSSLEREIESQRAIAEHYLRALKFEPAMLTYEKPGAFYNRFQFPIAFQSQGDRDFMADFLRFRRIEASKPMKGEIEIATAHYGYLGDCPTAERLSRTVLAIPCYHNLKSAEVQDIVRGLNDGRNELTSAGGRPGFSICDEPEEQQEFHARKS